MSNHPILNRLKIVLTVKDKSNKWLAEKLNVDPSTVSRWVKNHQQPSVLTFYQISKLLDVDLKDLFVSTKNPNKEEEAILESDD